ncbi:hypothetical protein NMD15_12900 [Plesiomonas shigelloides]|uniref:hypothetical protein n=1 Tax=Plesiomonas shigelloides TaxID=703 RepID=UPI00351D9500
MEIMFLISLLLAWPTAGLSIILFLAIYIGKKVINTKAKMHATDKLRAQKSFLKDNGKPPSWIQNQEKCEIFIHGIQNFAIHNGVPQSFLTPIINNDDLFIPLINYAGAMEQEGASFVEQQIAASELLIELWKKSLSSFN